MPRTRYTKTVRIRERSQIKCHRRELAALARRLRRTNAELVAEPSSNPVKERRRTRRDQDLLRKPKQLVELAQ
jgi:hypothetical protein